MIGTILIAVIGYGLAGYLFGVAIAIAGSGFAGTYSGKPSTLVPEVLGNALIAMGIAAVTRWLIGGAF